MLKKVAQVLKTAGQEQFAEKKLWPVLLCTIDEKKDSIRSQVQRLASRNNFAEMVVISTRRRSKTNGLLQTCSASLQWVRAKNVFRHKWPF